MPDTSILTRNLAVTTAIKKQFNMWWIDSSENILNVKLHEFIT